MKKHIKYLLIPAVVLLLLALIIINRNSMARQEELAATKQLSLTINGQENLYDYQEDSPDFVTFSTQMKRKNGEVTDKEYGGIELWDILETQVPYLSSEDQISVICADQYEVVLTATEIKTPGNIYLVTQENGESLNEESGPFMLVINQDEFSTRWAKNVIQVKIIEK